MIPDPNIQDDKQNLTGSSAVQDNDPVSEEADRLRNEPQRQAHEPLINENRVIRLKENLDFVQFVENNLWETRRDRGFPWKMDVFDYIDTVYKPWRGEGLLQSDLRALDPKLYAQLHKQLSAINDPDAKAAILMRLGLPKERSEEGLRAIVRDPAKRAELSAHRKVERARVAGYRQPAPS